MPICKLEGSLNACHARRALGAAGSNDQADRHEGDHAPKGMYPGEDR
jgi:hypothetical protein